MKTNRRTFIKAAGVAGAAMFTAGTASADDAVPPASVRGGSDSRAPFMTELFLDNQLLEVTPGVSRRLHHPKKHLLNPVIRCERWCDGDYIQPYTTMYDEEDKLFKMWARAGSDSAAGYVGGNAAFMLYFTSADGVHWGEPVAKSIPWSDRTTFFRNARSPPQPYIRSGGISPRSLARAFSMIRGSHGNPATAASLGGSASMRIVRLDFFPFCTTRR